MSTYLPSNFPGAVRDLALSSSWRRSCPPVEYSPTYSGHPSQWTALARTSYSSILSRTQWAVSSLHYSNKRKVVAPHCWRRASRHCCCLLRIRFWCEVYLRREGIWPCSRYRWFCFRPSSLQPSLVASPRTLCWEGFVGSLCVFTSILGSKVFSLFQRMFDGVLGFGAIWCIRNSLSFMLFSML